MVPFQCSAATNVSQLWAPHWNSVLGIKHPADPQYSHSLYVKHQGLLTLGVFSCAFLYLCSASVCLCMRDKRKTHIRIYDLSLYQSIMCKHTHRHFLNEGSVVWSSRLSQQASQFLFLCVALSILHTHTPVCTRTQKSTEASWILNTDFNGRFMRNIKCIAPAHIHTQWEQVLSFIFVFI